MIRITRWRLACGALVAVCLSGPFWVVPLLRSLDTFRVDRVEVSGVQLLAPHEVLAASGIRLGQNVWDDPAAWHEALLSHPVVRSATIERALPRGLRVRVEERRPVALLVTGQLRPVTADGELLPVDPARAGVDLPLLWLAEAGEDGETLAEPQARRVLAELARLGGLDPALFARVSEIRRVGADDLQLTLGRPAVELLLPMGADEAALRRLRAVLEDLAQRVARPSAPSDSPVRVDLRFADQVVVRFSSSS